MKDREIVYEAEGMPEEAQADAVYVPDGRGKPVRLEVGDDSEY